MATYTAEDLVTGDLSWLDYGQLTRAASAAGTVPPVSKTTELSPWQSAAVVAEGLSRLGLVGVRRLEGERYALQQQARAAGIDWYDYKPLRAWVRRTFGGQRREQACYNLASKVLWARDLATGKVA